MIRLRKSTERGHANHGWLDSRHTFSFADYHDPAHMHFHALRVINEDHIAGGAGFGMHPHRDMEIISYVVSGAMEHSDSMGNGSVIRPDELQRMSAGSGVQHSEFNASPDEDLHLYQIWLLPDQRGIKPEYEQKQFPRASRDNRLQLVASPDGSEGSLKIHQDARLYLGNLDAGKTLDHALAPRRAGWLQVVKGRLTVNGAAVAAGDGLAIEHESTLHVAALEPAEVLLFDLA